MNDSSENKTQYDLIYSALIELLTPLYPPQTVNLWFKPMKIYSVSDSAVGIRLPENRREFVEKQYGNTIAKKCGEILGYEVKAEFTGEENFYEKISGPEPAVAEPDETEYKSAYKERFNPAYTFKNFVVGKSNQLAQSAALAVAKRPAELNNPLFLYGNSGLGKTHLMFAMINEIRANHPDYYVLYVTGEEFTNELVESLAQKKAMGFREKYRNVDVLLIDDIQFIAGRIGTQEEFFHTFDTLYTANKQIIIASDRAPRDIDNLEDRLKSRFEMGLVADIQPPDRELRMAIFKRKAIDYDFDLSMEVLSYLADNITTNIRQIEGSLKKLKAHTLITGEQCTLPVAKIVLTEYFTKLRSENSTIDRIFDAVKQRFGVTREELKSSKRNSEIVFARHYAIYVIRKTTNLSQKAIAKLFNRDHTTIINSISFIEAKMKNDPSFEREINLLINELQE
ncbi:MAG: chromosomal replication initiator protein DnaA [Clostridia bacterium]|nr:chromosomal replication initiator protein DnaA [Clostridia bacterium]